MHRIVRGPIGLSLLALTVGCSQVVSITVDTPGASPARPPPPERFVCRYTKNPTYLSGGTLSLAGRPYATFEESETVGLELTIPPGQGLPPLPVRFTTGWVTFRSNYVPKDGLMVYPVEPLRQGVYTHARDGRMRVLGTTDRGLVEVEPLLSDAFRPTAPLRAQLTCEQTRISPSYQSGSGDTESEPDGGDKPEVELPHDTEVPVSEGPGGAPAGVLYFRSPTKAGVLREDLRATVLEARPEALRIRRSVWPGVVEGWVPRALTKAVAPPKFSTIFGNGGLLGGIVGGRGKPSWPRCASEVDLYLARDGALERVGELHAKAAVLEKGQSAGWTEVELPELKWINLEPGVTWALKAGGLSRCLMPPTPAGQ